METIKEINENEIYKTVNYRPNMEIYFTLLFGVGMLFIPFFPIRLLAIVFIILSLYCHVKIADHKTISFCKDCILIYNDDETILKIKYEEINEWGIRPNNATCGCIQFLLNDGTMHNVYSFQVEKARRELIKVINHLETGEKALAARSIEKEGFIKRNLKKFNKK